MVGRVLTGVLTGGYGFFNYRLKVPPLGVSQQRLEITGKPECRAGVLISLDDVSKLA